MQLSWNRLFDSTLEKAYRSLKPVIISSRKKTSTSLPLLRKYKRSPLWREESKKSQLILKLAEELGGILHPSVSVFISKERIVPFASLSLEKVDLKSGATMILIKSSKPCGRFLQTTESVKSSKTEITI